ncbi:MAG: serine/threonine protein kinase [Pseudomonadota bacterium]
MTETVHGTAIVVGTTGILIRGPSGAGKSSLAAALLDHAASHDEFAALVADDRVALRVGHGRLIARGNDRTHGLVEVRGRGAMRRATIIEAVIRLIVDFVPQANLDRYPADTELLFEIMNLILPRQPVPSGSTRSLDLVLAALHGTRADL